MSAQDNPYGASFGGDYTVQANGAATPESHDDVIKDTTTASFTEDVIQESRKQPVLVDFWAPWCGPCRQLTPLIEKAVRDAGGRVKLVKMNIDDHPAVAGQLGIQSIPAVIAFRDGQPVDGFMGAIPESQIAEFINKVGGPGDAETALAEALDAAGQLRAEGDAHGATKVYAGVLSQAPDNLAAIAGLAETLLDIGDLANAKEVLARAPAGSDNVPELTAARARIALADQVAELGDPAELERRLDADPNDHQARFDMGLIYNALDRRDEAADAMLAIMRADRSWNEDGARLQMLKFFEAWGMTDKATLAARRKLSSLLFS